MKPIVDATGFYSTAGRQPSLPARLMPSLYFYARFIREVFRFSALARQGAYGDEEWGTSSLLVLRFLEEVGVHVEISGLHILHRVEGPCVFVANHMSTLETIVLPGIIQPIKDVTFVVKRGIVEYPVFKHIMLSRDPIVVDRKSPREDLLRVLEEGTAILQRGRSVIVFPQTTRTLTFDPAQFNSIGIKLARKAQVPVVPVALKTDAWGIGRIVKEIGRIDPSRPVRFAFGEPLTIQGRGNAQQEAIVEFIGSKLREWHHLP